MKKHLLQIIFIYFAGPLAAQGILQGTLTDERHESLTGANVILKESGLGQVTDRLGKFRFQNLKTGKYTVGISFIGYETQTAVVDIQDGAVTALNVELKPGALQLSDVVVTSSPDRPINTLSQIDIKFRPVNTSQDVLRMVPGLFIAQHAGGGRQNRSSCADLIAIMAPTSTLKLMGFR